MQVVRQVEVVKEIPIEVVKEVDRIKEVYRDVPVEVVREQASAPVAAPHVCVCARAGLLDVGARIRRHIMVDCRTAFACRSLLIVGGVGLRAADGAGAADHREGDPGAHAGGARGRNPRRNDALQGRLADSEDGPCDPVPLSGALLQARAASESPPFKPARAVFPSLAAHPHPWPLAG